MGVFDLVGTTASGWLSDRIDNRICSSRTTDCAASRCCSYRGTRCVVCGPVVLRGLLRTRLDRDRSADRAPRDAGLRKRSKVPSCTAGSAPRISSAPARSHFSRARFARNFGLVYAGFRDLGIVVHRRSLRESSRFAGRPTPRGSQPRDRLARGLSRPRRFSIAIAVRAALAYRRHRNPLDHRAPHFHRAPPMPARRSCRRRPRPTRCSRSRRPAGARLRPAAPADVSVLRLHALPRRMPARARIARQAPTAMLPPALAARTASSSSASTPSATCPPL
jgi:hypothetical protein